MEPPLPHGLQLDIHSGAISGTPQQATVHTAYTVHAQSRENESWGSAVLAVEVQEAPKALTYGGVFEDTVLFSCGIAAEFVPTLAEGTPPFYFELARGCSLPSGLSLDEGTGAIRGCMQSVDEVQVGLDVHNAVAWCRCNLKIVAKEAVVYMCVFMFVCVCVCVTQHAARNTQHAYHTKTYTQVGDLTYCRT